MRVVISAGGTGGHIYPALAVIHKIKEKEPDSEFLYIGTHNRMEKEIIPKHNIPFESIEIYGFYRKKIWKNVKTLTCFWKSYQTCKKLMKSFKPDVVIGFGGYVTGPVIYAAYKLDIKTFIHEQNSIAGRSNQFLSKYASKIGVAFKSCMRMFPEYKTVFTGNPCGEEALYTPIVDKKSLGLTKEKKLVLFVMGSLGSSKMNELLVKNMSHFEKKDYEILFVTGKECYESICKNTFPKNVKVVPFLENLAGIMKQTDLMISRAGASTLSEIIALEVPSILIPSPYVPDNHQYKNAMDLVSKKAACLLEEKNIQSDTFVKEIDALFEDPNRLQEMKDNLKHFKAFNSATMIYELLADMVFLNHH